MPGYRVIPGMVHPLRGSGACDPLPRGVWELGAGRDPARTRKSQARTRKRLAHDPRMVGPGSQQFGALSSFFRRNVPYPQCSRRSS